MNSLVLLCLFAIGLSSTLAISRRRRELMPNSEFRFPRDCDDKKIPCRYLVKWEKIGNSMNFTWTANIEENQWVGLTWIKKVSLIGAHVYTLSFFKAANESEATPKLMSGQMDDKGAIHELESEEVTSPMAYDKVKKIATAKFSRILDGKLSASSEETDLTKCPIWIFLPDHGDVKLAESIKQKPEKPQKPVEAGKDKDQKETRFMMKLPEGTLFYAVSPNCKA